MSDIGIFPVVDAAPGVPFVTVGFIAWQQVVGILPVAVELHLPDQHGGAVLKIKRAYFSLSGGWVG